LGGLLRELSKVASTPMVSPRARVRGLGTVCRSCQDLDSLVVFRIDAATGKLTPVGSTVEAPVPVWVKFLAV